MTWLELKIVGKKTSELCLAALSEGFFKAFFPWKFLSFHGIGINWLNFKTELKAFFNSIYFGPLI